MPKMKTHRGAAKRFKVTGTGKIRRRKRSLGRPAEVVGGDKKRVDRLLGR